MWNDVGSGDPLRLTGLVRPHIHACTYLTEARQLSARAPVTEQLVHVRNVEGGIHRHRLSGGRDDAGALGAGALRQPGEAAAGPTSWVGSGVVERG
ncbi:hypothetical protein GCM10010271_04560 [Streptomyces kurssanovii]|nr:hypothetical protein GCM10010271_04560 [Streptomyces kurssanovii]